MFIYPAIFVVFSEPMVNKCRTAQIDYISMTVNLTYEEWLRYTPKLTA